MRGCRCRRASSSGPTLLLLAVYAVVYLQFAAQLASFPFDLDQGEGYDAWSAWLINLGQLPYTSNAAFPYYSSNYPPLWSYLVSIPMAWLGPGLAPARLLSTLAALAAAGVLWYRRPAAFGSHRLAGALAAGFFLASPYVFHTTPLARVNSLALLSAVVGLTLLETADPPAGDPRQPGAGRRAVHQADRDRRRARRACCRCCCGSRAWACCPSASSAASALAGPGRC